MDLPASFLAAHGAEVLRQAAAHLELVFVSVLLATLAGIPLGILIHRRPRLAPPVLVMANGVQTIPSIALLGFLLPLLGIVWAPAIVALSLYSLLPILRNTHAGLTSVAPPVVDAARGMGMTPAQILGRIELPLALPVIFAGLRTAAVTNVGITTLAAIIGAGGLGTFIFRGVATNNPGVILLGAVPAALLALAVDAALAALERQPPRRRLPALAAGAVVVAALALWPRAGAVLAAAGGAEGPGAAGPALRMGMTAEFVQRPDGLPGWRDRYGVAEVPPVELDPALLYDALRDRRVDVTCGFATDGRIAAYDLVALEDDRGFFPVYEAGILVRQEALRAHPGLRELLGRLVGALSGARMRALNLEVDGGGRAPRAVAEDFLRAWAGPEAGLAWDPAAAGAGVAPSGSGLAIATKGFTEQYILGEILARLVAGTPSALRPAPPRVRLRGGLGGTGICFDALRAGEIDLYPEYSGTILLNILQPDAAAARTLMADAARLNAWLRDELAARHDLAWIAPLGFNNTYTMLVRRETAEAHDLRTCSDLARLLRGGE